ncbi:MAG: hypothetical protein JW994_07850 [Candidatus Omnitrophica bacterium]|nr:hypothetical protein [Candidatus Omnitrophota bacterium]
MAIKKENVQKDINKLLDQARERFKKFGKELSILAKKSEKEIVKASKTGRVQIDIMGLSMQKEKLYYDIGKKIVMLNAKKSVNVPELEPYWKKLRKIETDSRKKKRELSLIRKSSK